MPTVVRIGTRGSKLALWQARHIKSRLEAAVPGITIELTIIKTRGDKILDVPLAKVGGKGLFVKEIESALLDGSVDLAVHSMKDMPAEIPEGLKIGPIPEREDPRDVLIAAAGGGLTDLPEGARVGTSSLRRGAQIRHLRPDIDIVPLRGNLDTRLRKLDEGQMDAVILAAAGVKRLGLTDRVSQYLETGVMLPAVAQGALCIEIRENDPRVEAMVSVLDHPPTRTVVLAERAFLNRLGGSCQVPIAGHGRLEEKRLTLSGLVAALDGSRIFSDRATGPAGECIEIGVRLAEALIDQGAGPILESIHASQE